MDYKKVALSYKEAMVKDLKALVSIESVYDKDSIGENAPFGKKTREALDYFLEMAKRDGFEPVDVDGYAGYIEYGSGDEIVGVLGHLDVVPLGDGWTKDPLGKDMEENYLFGRGTSDDKGPTVAAYYAIKALKDNNVQLSRRVRLIVGCDEETGFRCVKYYKEHCEIPTLGFTPDANFPIIYGEKGILQLQLNSSYSTIIDDFTAGVASNVVIGHSQVSIKEALLVDEFEAFLKEKNINGKIVDNTYVIEGKLAHAMAPQDGINAGVYMFEFLAKHHNDKYSQEIFNLLQDYNGVGLNINFTGKYMGKLTMNVGMINVDKNQSIVIDIRYPDGYSKDDVLENINKSLENTEISYTILEDKEQVFIDPESKMIKTLEAVYRSQTNDYTSVLVTTGGGTYAKAFENHVAYGMEFPLEEKIASVGDIHQANEAISLDSLVNGSSIYIEAIEKLANLK